jgi:hypothetical protein
VRLVLQQTATGIVANVLQYDVAQWTGRTRIRPALRVERLVFPTIASVPRTQSPSRARYVLRARAAHAPITAFPRATSDPFVVQVGEAESSDVGHAGLSEGLRMLQCATRIRPVKHAVLERHQCIEHNPVREEHLGQDDPGFRQVGALPRITGERIAGVLSSQLRLRARSLWQATVRESGRGRVAKRTSLGRRQARQRSGTVASRP